MAGNDYGIRRTLQVISSLRYCIGCIGFDAHFKDMVTVICDQLGLGGIILTELSNAPIIKPEIRKSLKRMMDAHMF